MYVPCVTFVWVGFLLCWRIHEAASCLVEIKWDFFWGGGMDSLINNHHPFLPDLNWSHMLSLEPRHKQLNVHLQILIEL